MKILQLLKQKYLANTFWLMLERGIQMIVALIVGIKLAVYLTEEEWGFYNWAISLVIIFAELARVGLPNIVVKFLVNKDNSEEEIMGSAFFLKFLGSITALLIIYGLAVVLEPDPMGQMLVLLVAIPYLIRSLDLIMYYFEAHVQSKYVVAARLTGVLLNNALKLVVIYAQLDAKYLYFIFGIEAIVFIALLILFYKKSGSSLLNWKVRMPVAKNLFLNAWPLIFSVVIYNLYMRIDQLMIKEMLGEAMNGNYAAATKLSTAWYAIPWLITGSIFPAIIKAFKTDYKLFLERFTVLYQFLILLAIMVIIPVTFLSDWLIGILYSGKYLLAADVLTIHIWASVFVFIGYAGTKWLIVKNLERLSFYFIATGAVVNIIVNYFLIPKYGINGAAWATLFSQFTSYLLMPLFHSESRIIFKTQMKAILQSITVVIPVRNIIALLKGLK